MEVSFDTFFFVFSNPTIFSQLMYNQVVSSVIYHIHFYEVRTRFHIQILDDPDLYFVQLTLDREEEFQMWWMPINH